MAGKQAIDRSLLLGNLTMSQHDESAKPHLTNSSLFLSAYGSTDC
ncbi:hypothetical protein [Thermocoleostomius sinensis]|uniref:Uncharacterized protein n=1 Tax=Thermocoleostomius sinensis A174 TaxID=2016057 RepID=A0A9E8ZC75_9CYAN|nr:hypothetical protein [Thermocoleostomius sinensis]WAL59234.1 hypothetical protein OXH18_18955 [Thermocoleostomius sinensis A174]